MMKNHLHHRHQRHKAKIIGVIQAKGGAGRSTLATNLAGKLNEQWVENWD
ncbi:MAG: hypothetical protein IOD09_11720 [Rhodocyclaceae bacterium]|jgi:Flp pilus assembly CpaE family ATPase|nr:hypothetical protein [Rhodocyclaceae bacterium]MCA3128355.1 hypothetical protein [Rhodocyclaceae bacterium]